VQQELEAAVALGKPAFALVEDGLDIALWPFCRVLNSYASEEAIESLQRSITAHRDKELAKFVAILVLILVAVGICWSVARDGQSA
jgi:hypothetical protein